MPFTPEQIDQLNARLYAQHVATRENGRLSYIEGWHAINEANRIFGFDAWSYSIEAMDRVGEGKNQKGTEYVQYLCKVKLLIEAGGSVVVREDYGYGTGYGTDRHEGAVKEAVTDALKRCLRTFGNPFGLALYDKTQANVGGGDVTSPEPEQKPRRLKQSLQTRMTGVQRQTITELLDSPVWSAEERKAGHEWLELAHSTEDADRFIERMKQLHAKQEAEQLG